MLHRLSQHITFKNNIYYRYIKRKIEWHDES